MSRNALVCLVTLTSACGNPQAEIRDHHRVPVLSPAVIQVDGVVPIGSKGLVLTDSMIVCVGDPGFTQVVCAPDHDWATAVRFGREGRGPTELLSVHSLGVGVGGSVIVSDWLNGRITWINPRDGTLIKSHRAPPLFQQDGPEERGLVVGSSLDIEGLNPGQEQNTPVSLRRIAVNSSTGQVEWETELTLPEEERTSETLPAILAGWQSGDGTISAVVSKAGIGSWDAEGSFLGTVVSPQYVPRSYSKSEAVGYWEDLVRGATRFGAPAPDSARRVEQRMTEAAPAYRGVGKMGPDGTQWLLTTGDGVTPGSDFEVFRGMDYLGRVRIPDTVYEFDLRGNVLVVLKDSGTFDEFGLGQRDLRFYTIESPEGAPARSR